MHAVAFNNLRDEAPYWRGHSRPCLGSTEIAPLNSIELGTATIW